MTPRDFALYAIVVFCWGTSWVALRIQSAEAAPETAVFWRFVCAAILMILWVRFSAREWHFPLRRHAVFLLAGVGMFSTNFIFYYHGGKVIISGLLPVLFSLAVVGNLLLGALFLGQRVTMRLGGAALMGIVGIGLMFAPEFQRTEATPALMRGIALCMCGTVCFCLGNLASALSSRAGVDVIAASAWGMVYGAIWSGLITLGRGESFVPPATITFLLSFLWLLLSATIMAFAAYLTLIERIGPGRASYAAVMYPVVGLLVSTFAETLVPGATSNFQWTALAFLGVGLAVFGNVLMLKR